MRAIAVAGARLPTNPFAEPALPERISRPLLVRVSRRVPLRQPAGALLMHIRILTNIFTEPAGARLPTRTLIKTEIL